MALHRLWVDRDLNLWFQRTQNTSAAQFAPFGVK